MKYLRRLEVKFKRGTFKNPIREQVREPAQVYSIFKDIKDEAKEVLLGVYLGEDLDVRSYEILTVGTRSETLCPTDDIFRGAILTEARYIILIHNHPAGEATPSPADRDLMEKLVAQAPILNRRILDFIIVGAGGFWSYFDEGSGGDYTMGALS